MADDLQRQYEKAVEDEDWAAVANIANAMTANANTLLVNTRREFPGASKPYDGFLKVLLDKSQKEIAKLKKTGQKTTQTLLATLKKTAGSNKTLQAQLKTLLRNQSTPKTAPPPPAITGAEAQSAAEQARLDATRRNGYRRTLISGDGTGGGYVSPATGRASLLG